MARRLGLLSGLAALALAIARLGRLLQPQVEGPSWQVVLLAAAILGAVFTWTALTYRLPLWAISAVNVFGAGLAALRVAAPATLRFGIVPTEATLPELQRELDFAVELLRFGSAPVLPVAGLIAVLAVLFWLLGAVLSYGLTTGRPLVATLPSLVLYLQLATLDRRPPGWGWMAVAAMVAGLALLASGMGPDPRTGRLRTREGQLLARRSASLPFALLVTVVAAGLVSGSALAASVPESGHLDWRNQTGLGSGLYGGTSFNLFVGLQQSLVDLGDDPLFFARVSDSAPPNQELYWRLITLDSFNGENWVPSDQATSRRGEDRWERPDLAFQGPTVPVAARVRIAALGSHLLPLLYSPTALQSEIDLIGQSFRVREDGSVAIDVRTNEGWEYELRAEVPQPDIGHLASVGGELSPIFQEAAAAGAFPGQAQPPRFEPRPDDIDRYLQLPDDISLAVRDLATEVTSDGLTRFEKALLLESWFRDPGVFTYSTDVSTGHSALDLTSWLLDPGSRNFRTGYCEQFATAYAVLARTLGIPSRVVLGFTPGDLETQSDGSELIVVRERNAHAWVELWMDGQGWIRFDPTPRADRVNPSLGTSELGFDPRTFVPAPEELEPGEIANPSLQDRRELLAEVDLTAGDPTPDLREGGGWALPRWAWWLLAALGLAGTVPGAKYLRRRRRLARIRTGDVSAAWEEIVDRLRDLGEDIRSDQTALEIARSQDGRLVPLATMYSAATYGGRVRGDGRAAFKTAEEVLTRKYETSRRLSAWLSVASLRRR